MEQFSLTCELNEFHCKLTHCACKVKLRERERERKEKKSVKKLWAKWMKSHVGI